MSFGVEKHYTDLHELANDQTIEAVYIASPKLISLSASDHANEAQKACDLRKTDRLKHRRGNQDV